MTGDKERGDAVADKWRDKFDENRRETDLALTRLDVRADMKSFGEEEDSVVIDQRALEAQHKKDSDPPARASLLVIVLTVVRKFPPLGSVLVALAAIAALTYLYATGRLGN